MSDDRQNVAQLVARIGELTEALNLRTQERDTALADSARGQQNLKNLQDQLNAEHKARLNAEGAANAANELQTEYDQLKNNYNKAQSQITTLQKQLEQLQTVASERDRLQQQIDQAHEEIKNLTETALGWKGQSTSRGIELDVLHKQVAALQSDLDSLQTKYTAVTDEANARIAAQASQLKAWEDETAAHNTEMDVLRNQNDALRANLSTAQNQLEGKNIEHQKQINDLNSQITNLNASITQAQEAIVTYKQQLIDQMALITERDNLKDQVVELRGLFADPPSGSGIDKVTRFRTSDGAKHKTLPDAQNHAAILGIMDELGVTETEAARILERRDGLRKHFDIIQKTQSVEEDK